MKGFKCELEKQTLENSEFEKPLYKGNTLQLDLQCLRIGEELGFKTNELHDCFFRFEFGIGKCLVASIVYEVKAGDALVVPAGAKYNIINVSDEHHLRFFTLCSKFNSV